jgi:uncharacterized membrane protein
MESFRHNVERYLEFSANEWKALLTTAAFAGFILSFRNWGPGVSFELTTGVLYLLFKSVGVFLLIFVQLLIQKLVGISLGLKVRYDKYVVPLVLGVFIAVFSFGWVPIFVTGWLSFETIDTLRLGRFRAALTKNWEMAFVAGAGILATVLITIPLHVIFLATGAAPVKDLILIAILASAYALIPLPVIHTLNFYSFYMGRLEPIQGNTPGFDIFFASPFWYFFLVGLIVGFGLIALTLGVYSLFFSIPFGILALFLYSKYKEHSFFK